MKKFVIIDGHHLIFRAFYAIQNLTTREGFPSNAIFGFASMILNILALENPDYFAIAFDSGKTFRHEEHKGYKGTRKERPKELDIQIPQIYEMVEKMNIPYFMAEGYEADDVLGTLATLCLSDKNIKTIIVTGDKDLLQMVNENIIVAFPHKGGKEPVYMDEMAILEKYNITPSQIPDFKGMSGDISDNIKGVQGLGPKGATKLLNDFKTLEGIYENLDKIKGITKTKLENSREEAFFAKYLATIITNVPTDFSLEKTKFCGLSNKVLPFFEKMNFNSLQKRITPFFQNKNKEFSLEENKNNKEGLSYDGCQNDQLSLF